VPDAVDIASLEADLAALHAGPLHA
jgi:hypothetical protein